MSNSPTNDDAAPIDDRSVKSGGRVHGEEKKILLIDNFDSFTWNLWHLIASEGAHCRVVRNNAFSIEELLRMEDTGEIDGYILSPGPCTPNEAGVCLQLCATTTKPLFGVCLGFQALCQSAGATIKRAKHPIHGKVHTISIQKSLQPLLFSGISPTMQA
ncbi:MAG: aminodeoxychorismate/anthranilate synthase component II, partial [Alphaproteobacteria bacterium]|nr:aminodeoxychorismate/anthranilate synthase component II [Alphaproteobacteria bacterium]